MRVINVGGGASRDLPAFYRGWSQDVLDIDPNVGADIVCDAKKMRTLKRGVYDAVFCSHNLEHFYLRDVPAVLDGFQHVLKGTGFAQIAVPDMQGLFDQVRGRDIMETWYQAGSGAISFHDVMYGWGKQIAAGNEFYAHHCGFSEKSLAKVLRAAGFVSVMTASDGMNIHAYAFKSKPGKTLLQQLGV
jgi:hypothetical protein